MRAAERSREIRARRCARSEAVTLGQVRLPGRPVEIVERAAGSRVGDDDDVPALPVAPVGGEAGVVEDAVEDGVGHRVGQEAAGRPRRPHDVVELGYALMRYCAI